MLIIITYKLCRLNYLKFQKVSNTNSVVEKPSSSKSFNEDKTEELVEQEDELMEIDDVLESVNQIRNTGKIPSVETTEVDSKKGT